jgi:hypothetical protein
LLTYAGCRFPGSPVRLSSVGNNAKLNRVWLKDTELSAAASRFFSAGGQRGREAPADDWTRLRERWEYSHVVRAVLAGVSFLAVAITTSIE